MEVTGILGYKDGTEWWRVGEHYFVSARRRGGVHQLQCAMSRCPVRVSWQPGQTLNGHVGLHNHEPTPWVEDRNALFQDLKESVRLNEDSSLHQIYIQVAERHPVGAPHLLYEAVMSSMRRWRALLVPRIPSNLSEYAEIIRLHERYNELYIGAVTSEGQTSLVLGSIHYQSILDRADAIIIDGTFQTRPTALRTGQLLTVHVMIAGHFFHPIVAFMPNRRRSTYEAVLSLIWRPSMNPVVIVTDYEEALAGAIRSVSGQETQGCFFHYTQALMRRAQQLGLQVRVRGSRAWKLVRLYCALACMAPTQIANTLAEIPTIATQYELPFSLEFHEYFVNFWMNRIGPHRFAVEGSPHRTTNVSESFHATLLRIMGRNPGVWIFTNQLKRLIATTDSRYQAMTNGVSLPHRNRARQIVSLDRLRMERLALDRGRLTLREYLLTVAGLLDPVIMEMLGTEETPELDVEPEFQEHHVAQPPPPAQEHHVAQPPPPAQEHHVAQPPLPAQEHHVAQPPLPAQEHHVAQPPPPAQEHHVAQPPLPAQEHHVAQPPLPAQEHHVAQPPPPAQEHHVAPPSPSQEGQTECKICLETEIEWYAFVPCGHTCCGRCKNRYFMECPFCRSEIGTYLRIYI